MRKIGIIGAGQTGRGFIARLLANDFHIVFADRDEALIDRLNAAGGFDIDFFGGVRESLTISGYEAHTMQDAAQALRDCEAVLIAVRAENTRAVGEWMVQSGLADMPVVACENAVSPAALLDGTGLRAASGAIFCTTVNDEGLGIGSENYPHLFVSRDNMPACLEGLDTIMPVDDFGMLMKRKLYTYNAASGIIAFMGQAMGYDSYPDAANDPRIDRALDEFYGEVNRAICAEFGVGAQEQAEFALLSKRKFQNRAILDTIARNAASPLRKLGSQERVMEPMRLILAHGGDAGVLMHTAACALRYAGATTEDEARALLIKAAGLAPDDVRLAGVLAAFEEVLA